MTYWWWHIWDEGACFNPHTHAGCDYPNTKPLFPLIVSIHTPTQGVTEESIQGFGCIRSFNPHTHAGCDSCHNSNNALHYGFNPHTHAGCDPIYVTFSILLNVSIHTPTQGVTFIYYTVFFNFRFNPHTHAGCDYGKWEILCHRTVSIHTPTQGVTISNSDAYRVIEFQSTHPRRVWHMTLFEALKFNSFNPHTHAGCDCTSAEPSRTMICFNPHTHAGCDLSNEKEV